MSRRAATPGLALVLLLLPAMAGAQQLRGVATDAEGRPLPGTVVALHRVGGGGGATVASTTTDDLGRFEFVVEATDSAVYFAAMRYQERMYIGPPVHPGFRPVDDYRITADPASEAGAIASAMGGGIRTEPPIAPPARSTGGGVGLAPWIVLILALGAAGALLATVPRHRRRKTRDALVELASLENRLADGADGDDADEIVRRRDHLLERLAPRA